MINVRHRFHGHSSLNRVYRDGQTVRGSLMSLKFTSRRAGQPYRLAVVVSRKVHRSAVIRNRIRRRLYEIARTSDPRLVTGKDMVLTVFSDQVASLPADKLSTMTRDLLSKTTKVAASKTQTPVSHGIVKSKGKEGK